MKEGCGRFVVEGFVVQVGCSGDLLLRGRGFVVCGEKVARVTINLAVFV